MDQLRQGLSRAREALGLGLSSVFQTRDVQTQATLLEEALLSVDVSPALAASMAQKVAGREPLAARQALIQVMSTALQPAAMPQADWSQPIAKPEVILIVGVNGSGKTTTCAKLAARFKIQNEKILLGAADTFRAAAVEQLELWAKRVNVPIVSQGQGADPGAVAFDSVKKGIAQAFDRVIIDTAGRLQTQGPLMDELAKIRRVCDKAMPGSPHRVLLVLDGHAGQNMLSQARLFHQAVPLSGLIITKLDGSAKAGALLSVSQELKLPVEWIGLGEDANDLQPFDALAFAKALVGGDSEGPALG